MLPRPTARIPKYRLHKPTGLGVVRLRGKDIYLGRHGTAESQAEYRRVIAEWLSAGQSVTETLPGRGVATSSLTINELVLAYLQFAKTYYVKNGRSTGELHNLKDAVKPLVLTHGHVPVCEFGPVGLKAVRQAMIDADLSRGVVNHRINRIRRVVKWGVENQLVAASVLHGLQAVTALKRGRCDVRETEPVTPVPDEFVDKVIGVAPKQIGAMIQLQRLTGMRPGEVVLMRTGDINTSEPIWKFVPAEHKTEHHGKRRVIHLGPQAQAVLKPLLKKDLEAFIFDPREVMADRRIAQTSARQSRRTPSETNRCRKSPCRRSPGLRYTTMSYARAISYACDAAFPHPTIEPSHNPKLTADRKTELDSWRKDHRWSPNRLRHNAATALRKQFGIEAARVVLGHSSVGVTEIYAELDLSKAAEVMARVG